MLKELKLFCLRSFYVISNKEAEELNLKHYKNVYGDGINAYGCRSLWEDTKGRIYRVESLVL